MGRKFFASPLRTILLHLGLALTAAASQAAPWLPFGPDGGDARRMATDPHDATHLFLGTATGWVYESHNSGTNWRRLAQVGKRDDLVIDSIYVDPTNPKHLVVGAWVIDQPDGGLFLSNDGGQTWLNQAEMRGQSIRSLAMAPSDPRILIAGSLQGVFRSNDGGQRWKRISPADSTEIHEIESVAIDPVDPNIIYAGTWHLPWKTTDGGEHWDNIKTGIIDDSDVFSIIVDPKSPQTVYASACSGIYKSENAGQLFHKIQGIPSTARRTRVLLQDPQRLAVVFAGTTEGLFRSEDEGKTWTRTTGPEIIVNDVSIDAHNSKRVLIATDRGGVLASDDGGDTFHASNGGFSARQITSLKRDSQRPASLYIGVVNDKEWGGVFQSENGGLSWTQRSEGLQGRDVFALGQAPDGAMIAGTSHGLFRLDTESQTWKRVDGSTASPDEPVPVETRTRAAIAPTRAPVPINRNQFAQRGKSSKSSTAMQKRATFAGGKNKSSLKGMTASHKAQVLAAQRKRPVTTKGKSKALVARVRPKTIHPVPAPVIAAVPAATSNLLSAPTGFDGTVSVVTSTEHTVLAATSAGLLSSDDNGTTWQTIGPRAAREWRYMAAAKNNVVGASMQAVQFSSDAGITWVPVTLPENLTRISAVAVEPSGDVWVGGREGVFVSSDCGITWTTPKNLYVNAVSSLFYDDILNRITLTTGGYSSLVFTVQLPQRSVTYADTGWTLRFARPVGDHLVAATLFDGIVIQPKLVASPVTTAAAPAP